MEQLSTISNSEMSLPETSLESSSEQDLRRRSFRLTTKLFSEGSQIIFVMDERRKLKYKQETRNISSCLLLLEISNEKNLNNAEEYALIYELPALEREVLPKISDEQRANQEFNSKLQFYTDDIFCREVIAAVNTLVTYYDKLSWCAPSIIVEVICEYILDNVNLEIEDLTSKSNLKAIAERVEKYYEKVSYKNVARNLYYSTGCICDHFSNVENESYFCDLPEEKCIDIIANALMLYHQRGNDYVTPNMRDFVELLEKEVLYGGG